MNSVNFVRVLCCQGCRSCHGIAPVRLDAVRSQILNSERLEFAYSEGFLIGFETSEEQFRNVIVLDVSLHIRSA